MKYSSYKDILHEELVKRKKNNPAYSVRAFARDLEILSPRLNNILNDKQGLSVEAAKKISSKLNLTDKKKKWFYLSVGSLHSRSEKEKDQFKKRIFELKEEAKVYSEINLDFFSVISEWYHFGILELINLTHFKNDIQWIASTLDITPDQVMTAIQRMKKLDLIKEEHGQLKSNFKFLATPSEIPSEALKKQHTEIMQKALVALKTQSVETREFSVNKMTINKSQLPHLKERLKDLRREFVFQAEKDSYKDAVYCLSMQFFSLTQDSDA